MDELFIGYSGINDYITGWQLKSLVEEYIGNREFETWFERTIRTSIETIDQYSDNLKVKVILQLSEAVAYINSEEYKSKLDNFYSKIESFVTIRNLDIKLIRFINSNVKDIVECDNNEIIAETLKFIINIKGFKCWETIIDNNTCTYYLGHNHFHETQNILKSTNKELLHRFIKKILLPLNIHAGLKHQLKIVSSIRNSYKDIADEYENTVMEYLTGKEFLVIDSYQKQTIIKCIIDSRCFNNKNEILLNKLLLEIESEVREMVSNEGKSIDISSEMYMNMIERVECFRDKLFLLLYVQHISLFHLMMIEKEKFSFIDIGDYNGISKNKYKNSTLMNINHIKRQIQVNTYALMKNYNSDLWNELNCLINDVINITEISDFLRNDIVDLRFLIDNEKSFIAGTFLSQIIERLLRELYFKLEYDVVGILKSSNFTLKNLLDQDKEKNPLIKLFDVKELEALNFFLNDRENGENLRNNIAHYLIDSNELSEMDVIFLLDIMIFILLKVDYQGIVFENDKLT